VTPEIAGQLAACDILMAAQTKDYCMFVRGNCMALVKAGGDGFASIGSSGMMTENGPAYLVWSGGKAMLSSHGSLVEADGEQVEAIQRFSEELKKAIWPRADHNSLSP
jgi:hypothetical protein